MSKASGKDRQLRRQSAAKENKKERKIEPWRIIVGTVSIAFIMFLWVRNGIASSFAAMPKKEAIPLADAAVAVSAAKASVIAGVILLAKRVIGKIKHK